MSEYAIFAEGLGRRFGEVMAVDSVDLSVSRGEIYGFLGPNGAGKSTTVRMLITLLMPTKGRAFVGGKDVVQRAQEVRLIIGAALQEAALDNGASPVVRGEIYGFLGRSQPPCAC